MIAAVVWHWWLSVFLVAGSAVFVIATVAGYLMQVSKDRYSPREPRRE